MHILIFKYVFLGDILNIIRTALKTFLKVKVVKLNMKFQNFTGN